MTEEDVRFICENIMAPVVAEITKSADIREEAFAESLNKIFDLVVKRFNQIEYEQRRDRAFFKQMFIQYGHYDADSVHQAYNAYCKQYDEWAKENLNESKVDH